VHDWNESTGPGGEKTARLGGTRVTVKRAAAGAPGAWTWEVRFADGQVQVGHSEDPDAALKKGKETAERFLP
jgi:hypothetical protein